MHLQEASKTQIDFGYSTSPNPGIPTLASSDIDLESFVAWIDTSGQAIRAIAGTGSDVQIPRSVAGDALGNTYVTGLTFAPITFGNFTTSHPGFFLAKIDASGNVVWVRGQSTPGANEDSGNDLAIDSHGNIFIAGSFHTSSFALGGIILPGNSLPAPTAFIASYDPAGNITWAMGGSSTVPGSSRGYKP